ncbi:MAG: carboxypeptidase regulatory-like domain-containing protein [Myxococcales bacterium]|nr:carboxypeptidase regulatory-like domain-containing protein [Myxococcales bacterium]
MTLLVGIGLLLWWATGEPSSPKNSAPAVEIDAAGRGQELEARRPALAPRTGSGEHVLTGVVRGALLGKPIPGAFVTASLELGPGVRGEVPESGEAIVATTDAKGAFILSGLYAGRHRLRIEGQGLVTAELRFVDAPGEGVLMLVSREVQVSGQVLGGMGALAQVRVYLRTESQARRREARVQADGSFEFGGLAEGRFQIWAEGPGQAAPIQWIERVGVGPFAGADVTMQVAHSVTGRVVETGGSGLGIVADVVMRSATSDEASRSAVSLEDGTFVVPGLLAGRWTAEASAPGYVPSAIQTFSSEAETALQLTIGTGGQVLGVVRSASDSVLANAHVQLVGTGAGGEERRYAAAKATEGQAASLATGQEFLDRGELGVLLGPIPLVPPPGAFVSRVATPVFDGEAEPTTVVAVGRPSRFVTDSLGRFRISGVQAGRYRLHVSHADFATATTALLNIRAKGKAVRQNVVLHTGTKLSGKVLTGDGVAVAGASVFARFFDGRTQGGSVTDEGGGFAFAPIAGRIELVVEAVGYGRVKQPHKLSKGGLIAAVEYLDISLVKANAVMEGRLVDAAGFPVRGALVAVAENPSGLPVRPARSDSEGLFRIEGLLPGQQGLLVTHSEHPELRVTVPTSEDLEIIVPLGARIEIHVRDVRSDAPISMASVVVAPKGKSGEARGTSDEKGRVVFAAVPAGPCTISASLDDYALATTSAVLVAQRSRNSVPQIVIVEMSRGSILAGIVRDETGDRVAGATVSAGAIQTKTDAEGRFRLERVRGGAITLVIRKDGAESRETHEVDSGEERVTMELLFAPGTEDAPAADAETPVASEH